MVYALRRFLLKRTEIPMANTTNFVSRTALSAALALSAMALAQPASAAVFAFNLDGSGVSAAIQLTYEANPLAVGIEGTSPNASDPVGSYIVTGITGTFSSANAGISNATIGGIVASVPGTPTFDNLFAPHSFGFYPVANANPAPGGNVPPGLSYDNLFYPDGSPQAASDYPFHGGFFDIYGLVFTIGNGNAVNLWSNGDFGGGAIYGAAVTDGTIILDYTEEPVALTPAVPEPATWALMIAGFGLIGATMRRRRPARVAVSFG
jgi:hypothetical protein